MSVPVEQMLGLTVPLGMDDPLAAMGVQQVEGASIEPLASGDVVVSLDGVEPVKSKVEFSGNLATEIPDSELTKISQSIQDWVHADEAARMEWMDALKDGLQKLGITAVPNTKIAIKNAAGVTHPMLAEAVVQFQARAVTELFPPTGPAKGMVLGDANEELLGQANRVAQYLNYHLTVGDRGYFEDSDQLLIRVAMAGSQFRKLYKDPVTKKPLSRSVQAEDLLVPYVAKNIRETPRLTHIVRMSGDDVRRAMKAGTYRDVPLGGATTPLPTSTDAANDEADKRSAVFASDDDQRTLHECHCDLELSCEPGLLPYIVTVDKDALQVLSIRRNWKEADPKKLKRLWFVQYKYLPGTGLYGWGLLHVIGQLGEAATGLLRAMLDSAARANFSGGFRSKEGRLTGTMSPGLGEWIDVDLNSEEMKSAFFPLPFKEPGSGLFAALSKLEERGQRFGATVDTLVGDAGNSGPVGTTMALIEQGLKPQAAIHRRLHAALGEELQLLAELIAEDIPEEGYPYFVEGGGGNLMATDFDDRIDVAPVSDPNIVTNTQRILQAQSAWQLMAQAPQLYTDDARRMVHRSLLKALRVPGVDQILPAGPPKEEVPPPLDPVTENRFLLAGKPIAAYSFQDHAAHELLHSQAEGMIASLPLLPEQKKAVAAALAAHRAEHASFVYLQAAQALAGPQMAQGLPTLDPGSGETPLPPEQQEQLGSQIAAGLAEASKIMPMVPPSG